MRRGTRIEECAACVAAKLVFFSEWKTVANGPGRAACCLELVGKTGDSGSGRFPGKMCRYKSGDRDHGALDGARRNILKYATRRGSNIFQLLDTKEKKEVFHGKQKALVGAPRREGSLARKMAK